MRKTKLFALMLAVVMAFNVFAVAGCSKKGLAGIEITNMPKTAYKAGEKFDKKGMVVTAKFDNAAAKDVTKSVKLSIEKGNSLNKLKAAEGTVKVTVTYGKKTAEINITVIDLNPSALSDAHKDVIKYYTDLICGGIDKTGWSVAAAAELAGLGAKMVAAFENAGITDAEFDKLEEFVDELQKVMSELAGYDTNCEEFCPCGCQEEGGDCDCKHGMDMGLVMDAVLGLLGKFNETDITNQKIARLAWEIVAGLRGPIEKIWKDPTTGDAPVGTTLTEFFGYYDSFLAVGQLNFIQAVTAILDLSATTKGFDFTVFDKEPTKEEFKAAANAIKADVTAAIDILNQSNLNAMASFVKVFVPLLSGDMVKADKQAAMTAKIIEIMDAAVVDSVKLLNSIRATLNIVDDAMLGLIFDMTFGTTESSKGTIIVLISKLVNAALNANDGVNGKNAAGLVEKYFGFILDGMTIPGDASAAEIKEVKDLRDLILKNLDTLIAGVAGYAAKGYDYEFGTADTESDFFKAVTEIMGAFGKM